MRSHASDATYVEFATARQEQLRQIAYAVSGDWREADDILRDALTQLYVAWPRIEYDGTEEASAREVVVRAGRRRRRGTGASAPGTPVTESLMAGQRIVRRRRRQAAWVAAATVLAVVAVSPLLLPRTNDPPSGVDDGIPRPAQTRMPPQGTVHLLTAPAADVAAHTPPVLYLFGRMFRRDRGVTVLATYGEIDHAIHPRGGAIVRTGNRTFWVALVGNEPGRLVRQREAPYDYPAFMAWARSQIT